MEIIICYLHVNLHLRINISALTMFVELFASGQLHIRY